MPSHLHKKVSMEDSESDGLHQLSKEDSNSHGLHLERPLFNKRLTTKDRQLIELKIMQLKDKLDSGDFSDPEDKIVKEEEMEELEQQLNKRPDRDPQSSSERARVNITRSIKIALAKIREDVSIGFLSRYLNKTTIKTGDTCKYDPNINDKPAWILDPETVNQSKTTP